MRARSTSLIVLGAVVLAAAAGAPAARAFPQGDASAFAGTGMWIWYVSKSADGTAAGIASQARRYGVSTVFVKSSDGSSWWRQYSPGLVAQLKAAGLHVCAWQFVYGRYAVTEASLGARAAQTGADCLVIDAEGQYEGLYASAQTYIEHLRDLVGPDYPLGLSSFPYVDYHPELPYSVFLGPGGAQHNVPQVYWKAIGTSVDEALAHTYRWNSVYGRPISPLGQLYEDPSTREVQRFRALAAGYGATGVSWWSWQSASRDGWSAIAPPDPSPIAPAPPGYPLLRSGSKGDVVLWAQEHLMSAGEELKPNGHYDSATAGAVRAFQAAHGLPVTGEVDDATWPVLLGLEPARVSWTAKARPAPMPELRASRSAVAYRGHVSLSGVAHGGPGSHVRLEVRRHRAWRTLATVVAGDGGRFSRSLKAGMTHLYRAVEDGQASPAVRVQVRPRIATRLRGARSLSHSRYAAGPGSRLVLRARVRPMKRRLIFRAERRRHGHWHTARRVVERTHRGRARAVLRLTRRGTYRLRVLSFGDWRNAYGHSHYTIVKVKR